MADKPTDVKSLASQGGKARALALTPERRKEIAQKAVAMRWAKIPTGMLKDSSSKADEDGPYPSPFAKFKGVLSLGRNPVDCYVLDTGERIISLRAVVKSIANTDHSNLGEYLGASALKPFIDKDLVLGETKAFLVPGTHFEARGISAECFLEICNAYVKALEAGALSTDKQREIAVRCSIVLGACAKVGLIALIDEATGYQYFRAQDALELKLQAFIAEELREWEKTFPDELWEQFGRLTNWKGALHQRPKWWGKLVMELVYDALDKDVADHLRDHKPPPVHGRNYHQWITQDIGLKALIPHIYEVIGIAKTCSDMRELRDKVAEYYGKQEFQFTMYLKPPA